MLAYIASGALGLVRQSAINAAFGAGAKLDAFMAAQRVPETLFVRRLSRSSPVFWLLTMKTGHNGWQAA